MTIDTTDTTATTPIAPKAPIALVTGASRGIGEAILRELARQGNIVIGTATSQAGADAISDTITKLGAKGMGAVYDARNGTAITTLLDLISERLGASPAILVNNAGITRDNLIIRMKEEEWDEIQAVNLKPVFTLSKAVLKGMMKARFGRIISVTSVIGHMGNAGQTNYAAAKAGVAGFTRALAREVGSRAITVNCVAPGFIETDMTRALADDQVKRLVETVPLGRLGRVEDVAHAVAFLASREAGYITGSTLHVNGGMFMD